jgi:hypothetical protein
MTTYKWIGPGKVVEAHLAPQRRMNGKAPNVIRDEMDMTWHPGNGKRYSSKRAFRQATRDAGCVEVGNDPAILGRPRAPVAFNPTVRRQEIRESIRRQLHGGRA